MPKHGIELVQGLGAFAQALGVDTRSNGRARNRYEVLVRAPTGQIWMVLPEK